MGRECMVGGEEALEFDDLGRSGIRKIVIKGVASGAGWYQWIILWVYGCAYFKDGVLTVRGGGGWLGVLLSDGFESIRARDNVRGSEVAKAAASN